MRQALLAMVVLVASMAIPHPAVAEDVTTQRIQGLEEQLRQAQERIDQLERRERRRTREAPQATPDPVPSPGKAIHQRSGPPEPEPMELLIETLHKQGAISDADYAALANAMTAKREADARRKSEKAAAPQVATVPPPQTNSEVLNNEPTPAKEKFPARVKYQVGKGFTLATDDGRFDLTITNRIQFRYTFLDPDDPLLDDLSSFGLRRANTIFQGHALLPTISYRIQVGYVRLRVGSGQSTSNVRSSTLDEAWLLWRPETWAGIQAGQFRIPYDRETLTRAGRLQFVDRSIAAEFFGAGRDLGLGLSGSAFGDKSDLLRWEAGLFNGNGTQASTNDGTGQAGAVRLLALPLGSFDYYSESDVENTPSPVVGFGAGGIYNSQADSSGRTGEKAALLEDSRILQYFGTGFKDKFDIIQGTADTHFKWRGFSLAGEYYWAQAQPSTVPSKRARGYDVQAGYFLWPKRLEAAARYASVTRDMSIDRSGLSEVGGGLGYFFLGHDLKIQMDLRRLVEEQTVGADLKSWEYTLQLTTNF